MSEEEIIDKAELLTYEVIVENNLYNWDNMSPNEKATIMKGLLDLYNKEKEKNKELENADLTTVYMNGFYDGEKKWKDKIKEKLKYQYMLWNTPNRQKEYNQELAENLEDLLEEDNK